MASNWGYVASWDWQEAVRGFVLFGGFEEFGQLLLNVIRGTNFDGGQRPSGLVRRSGLLDAIVNVSSKPVWASQPSRRATAYENHQNTAESEQHDVKCGVVANAVGTAVHSLKSSTYFLAGTAPGSEGASVGAGVGVESGPRVDLIPPDEFLPVGAVR